MTCPVWRSQASTHRASPSRVGYNILLMSSRGRKYFTGPNSQQQQSQPTIEMVPVTPKSTAAKSQKEDYHDDDCGPVEKRECTDILCCVLFLLNLMTFIGVAIYGYIEGRPADLLGIYNDQNQMCSRTAYPGMYSARFSCVHA